MHVVFSRSRQGSRHRTTASNRIKWQMINVSIEVRQIGRQVQQDWVRRVFAVTGMGGFLPRAWMDSATVVNHGDG